MDLRGRTPTSIQEHGAVLAAIVERDPTAAEAAMRVHLSSVASALRPAQSGERSGGDGRPTNLSGVAADRLGWPGEPA
jgi:DNA-binding GntR family transcriptional regulator